MKAYLDLLQDILDNGTQKSDRTGTGTLSVFGRQIRHNLLNDGFPLLTTKRMYWKGVITELYWFLHGGTNIKDLIASGCNIWNGDAYKNYCTKNGPHYLSKEEFVQKIMSNDDFAIDSGDLGKVYGYQWRNWNGQIDQIQNVINTLKTNPDDRRMMVSAWNPSDLDDMTLPPCHYGFQVWTRPLTNEERKDRKETRGISILWNQRSCDFPLGIPFDLASYGALAHIIGKVVGMVPLEVIGSLGDCHIYLNQIDGVKEQLRRIPASIHPELVINDTLDSYDTIDDFLMHHDKESIQIKNYLPLPSIYFPLSN